MTLLLGANSELIGDPREWEPDQEFSNRVIRTIYRNAPALQQVAYEFF